MQVVLCCMAKNEHLYINDFVEFYRKIGFDKIYIFDNDELNTHHISSCIKNKDKVIIKDIRGMKYEKLQQFVYTHFYKMYKFDWCLFCDVDEFLFGIDDIHKFLSDEKFNDYDQIRIKWKLFGDDDLVERDMNKPVYEIFSHEVKSSLNRNLIDKGNLEIQGKAIVRGGIDNVVITSPHFASLRKRNNILKSCLPSGKPCESQVVIYEDYSNESVFLHHYMTKTISEFVNQKLNRNDAVYNKKLTMDYFWRINKKTKDKIDFLKKNHLLYN